MYIKNKNELIQQTNAIDLNGNVYDELVWHSNLTSQFTKETYRESLKQFCSFLNIDSLNKLRAVQSIDVIRYRDWLIDTGRSSSTINTRLATLSSIYKHLIEKQVLQINPVYGVKRMRKEYRKVKTRKLSKVEASKLISQADESTLRGMRNKAILTIFFNLGTRVGTICRLKGKDVYEEDGYLIIDMPLKGGKREQVAVNSHIQSVLKKYFRKMGYFVNENNQEVLKIPKDNPLFPKMALGDIDFRHKPMPYSTVYKMWTTYAKKAGIDRSSTHSARVTFATLASQNGCDIESLQNTLGHSDIRTTRSYIQSATDYAKSASFSVSIT